MTLCANDYKTKLLAEIERRFGSIERLPGSRPLIELKNGIRIYLRYSKLHGKGVAFFGLRRVDLNSLDGHLSYLCFFTDREPPLFIPYADFEAVIRQSPLASDGQYKVQISYGSSTKELYLSRVGHFNMDAFGGLDVLPTEGTTSHAVASNLSHWQVQTLLGGIGMLKGYSVCAAKQRRTAGLDAGAAISASCCITRLCIGTCSVCFRNRRDLG